MSTVFVDFTQITAGTVSASDTNGTPFMESGYTIPVVIPDSEVAGLLAAFDSTNQYSPSAADSRTLARLVLIALVAAKG